MGNTKGFFGRLTRTIWDESTRARARAWGVEWGIQPRRRRQPGGLSTAPRQCVHCTSSSPLAAV